MRGLDLDGNEIVLEGDDLLARMIQHEIDHLDGVLLLDRLEPDVRREALREHAHPRAERRASRPRSRAQRPRPRPLAPRRSGATRLLRHARRRGPGARSAARGRARHRARRHPARHAPGARERREPEPGAAPRPRRSGSRCSPRQKSREVVDDVAASGAELGVVVAFGQLLPLAVARSGAARVRERALLAVAALARRGAGRARRCSRATPRPACASWRSKPASTPGRCTRASARPIGAAETAGELRTRLVGIGTELLVDTLPRRADGHPGAAGRASPPTPTS